MGHFELDEQGSWLVEAERRSSPFCNPRPCAMIIDLIVVHGISLPPEIFGGNAIDALFTGGLDCSADPYFSRLVGLKVSTHLFIRRDGHILQYVPFHLRAWHAGASCFNGRTACNDFSIGIELEGADHIPYTRHQYETLSLACQALMNHYPAIHPGNIVGHNQISPGRKTDPGPAFDWSFFTRILKHHEIGISAPSPD